MSPALRSRQLLLWAHLHKTRADWAVYMGQASQRLVVKALVAAERARALNPSCWRQVGSVIMQHSLARATASAWTYPSQ